MTQNNSQVVGVVGAGALAALVARVLASAFTVLVFDPDGAVLPVEGVEKLDSLAALAARARVVLLAGGAVPVEDLAREFASGCTVVDLRPSDPLHARRQAEALSPRGIAFVDAPLHAEHLARFPEDAAFFCGGPAGAVADVLPLLECLGATVVACGETGAGQTMRALVGAVAVCNRLVSYECAAMGAQNGLSVADMGAVLNRCSGANSATARVLPVLVAGTPTADAPLEDVAGELVLCTQLTRRVGAPALIANQAAAQVLAASRTLGPDATLDDLRSLVERGSNFRFTA